MNLGLAGKVALVTGGARDIGREIALVLGREGAAVAVNYSKSKDEAEATAAEIRSAGGRATPPTPSRGYGRTSTWRSRACRRRSSSSTSRTSSA